MAHFSPTSMWQGDTGVSYTHMPSLRWLVRFVALCWHVCVKRGTKRRETSSVVPIKMPTKNPRKQLRFVMKSTEFFCTKNHGRSLLHFVLLIFMSNLESSNIRLNRPRADPEGVQLYVSKRMGRTNRSDPGGW